MTTSQPHRDVLPSDSDGPVPRLAVVVASVRSQRFGDHLGEWAATRARESFDVETIDLSEVTLPNDQFLGSGGGQQSDVADRIADASAFLFVMPEYNHSFPASLKQLIDWHYTEWMFKPASVISYGMTGGWSATEQLRQVLSELSMHTTRRTLGLAQPWESVNGNGFEADRGTGSALDGVLAELLWWAELLDDARRTRPFDG